MKEKLKACKCLTYRVLDEYISEAERMSKHETWEWQEAMRLKKLAKMLIKVEKCYDICKELALEEGVYDSDHHDHEDYRYYIKSLEHDGHPVDSSMQTSSHTSVKM